MQPLRGGAGGVGLGGVLLDTAQLSDSFGERSQPGNKHQGHQRRITSHTGERAHLAAEPARAGSCADGRLWVPEQDNRFGSGDQLTDRGLAPAPDLYETQRIISCGNGCAPDRIGSE